MRKRLREQIRSNERRGWAVAAEPGRGGRARATGRPLSGPTPRRWRGPGAAERYLFDERLLRAAARGRDRLAAAGGAPGRGTRCRRDRGHQRLLPALLPGRNRDGALEDSPMKNLFAAMISLAGELGLRLHLGGGVEPGDSLDNSSGASPTPRPRFARTRSSAMRPPTSGWPARPRTRGRVLPRLPGRPPERSASALGSSSWRSALIRFWTNLRIALRSARRAASPGALGGAKSRWPITRGRVTTAPAGYLLSEPPAEVSSVVSVAGTAPCRASFQAR